MAVEPTSISCDPQRVFRVTDGVRFYSGSMKPCFDAVKDRRFPETLQEMSRDAAARSQRKLGLQFKAFREKYGCETASLRYRVTFVVTPNPYSNYRLSWMTPELLCNDDLKATGDTYWIDIYQYKYFHRSEGFRWAFESSLETLETALQRP